MEGQRGRELPCSVTVAFVELPVLGFTGAFAANNVTIRKVYASTNNYVNGRKA